MVLIKHSEDKNVWVQYIVNRIRLNKNFIGFFSGPTGSGKSYATLSLCQQVDPNFTPEQIVFSPQELMKLINSDKLKSGSAIAFEEAGISLDATKWQSTMNRMIRYLMETFRHRNFVLLINAPYMDFVDGGTRRLFHTEFQTIKIDYERKLSIVKPLLLSYNSRFKKFYYKYLRVRVGDGYSVVKLLGLKKPTKELLVEYERKKRGFTDALNEDILRELTESKVEKPRYQLRCQKCDHSWKSKVEKPQRCPKCNCRLKIEQNPLENQPHSQIGGGDHLKN